MKSNQKVSVSDKIKIWSSRNQIIKAAASNQQAAASTAPPAEDAETPGKGAGGGESTEPGVQLRSRDLPPNRNNNSPLNQCINELTSNLHSRRCVSELVAASSSTNTTTTTTNTNTPINDSGQQSTTGQQSTNTTNGSEPTANGATYDGPVESEPEVGRVTTNRTRSASQSEAQPLLASPSHFVTVIEVKESKSNNGGRTGGDNSSRSSETPAVS
uniref:Uncharacterized protein n=1 Tax=Anopheles maculatus TaxID=74869 RepID=A0A182SAZ3_9DIPT